MCEKAIENTKLFDYADLVELIRVGDIRGEEELYRVFVRGFRYLLARSMPAQDVEDTLHDTFIALAQAVRRRAPRDPEALPAFAYTILRRQIANVYRARKMCAGPETAICEIADDSLNGLDMILEWEQRRELERALTALAPAEREVIIRLYIADESPKRIQSDAHLTEARFYRLKARGLKKLLAVLRKQVQRADQPRTIKCEKIAV